MPARRHKHFFPYCPSGRLGSKRFHADARKSWDLETRCYTALDDQVVCDTEYRPEKQNRKHS